MLNFILNIWHIITGDIKAVTRWITTLVGSVYSYIDRLYHYLLREVIGAYDAVNHLASEAWHYITTVYDFARSIVDVVIRDLISWVERIWNDVRNFSKDVYNDLVKWVDWLVHAIESTASDIYKWVIAHVWDPLTKDVFSALHWIEHEGAFIYRMITHPELLAKMVGKWFLKEWVALLVRFGPTVTRWIVHNLKSVTGDLLKVLEDILSAHI